MVRATRSSLESAATGNLSGNDSACSSTRPTTNESRGESVDTSRWRLDLLASATGCVAARAASGDDGSAEQRPAATQASAFHVEQFTCSAAPASINGADRADAACVTKRQSKKRSRVVDESGQAGPPTLPVADSASQDEESSEEEEESVHTLSELRTENPGTPHPWSTPSRSSRLVSLLTLCSCLPRV